MRSCRAFETSTLTPLVVDIATPCLIFATFAKTSVLAVSFATVAFASAAAIGGFALARAAVLHVAGLRVRTFLPALTFPNNGNLGLPLPLYAFGREGLGYAIVFYAICMIGQFTVGQATSTATRRRHCAKTYRGGSTSADKASGALVPGVMPPISYADQAHRCHAEGHYPTAVSRRQSMPGGPDRGCRPRSIPNFRSF